MEVKKCNAVVKCKKIFLDFCYLLFLLPGSFTLGSIAKIKTLIFGTYCHCFYCCYHVCRYLSFYHLWTSLKACIENKHVNILIINVKTVWSTYSPSVIIISTINTTIIITANIIIIIAVFISLITITIISLPSASLSSSVLLLLANIVKCLCDHSQLHHLFNVAHNMRMIVQREGGLNLLKVSCGMQRLVFVLVASLATLFSGFVI